MGEGDGAREERTGNQCPQWLAKRTVCAARSSRAGRGDGAQGRARRDGRRDTRLRRQSADGAAGGGRSTGEGQPAQAARRRGRSSEQGANGARRGLQVPAGSAPPLSALHHTAPLASTAIQNSAPPQACSDLPVQPLPALLHSRSASHTGRRGCPRPLCGGAPRPGALGIQILRPRPAVSSFRIRACSPNDSSPLPLPSSPNGQEPARRRYGPAVAAVRAAPCVLAAVICPRQSLLLSRRLP